MSIFDGATAIRDSPSSQERTGYDTAQICLNGHVINRSAEDMPQYRQNHCSKCGAETLMSCPACSEKIRGNLLGAMPSLHEEPAPAFCHNCGKAYPWIQQALEAARELAFDVITGGLLAVRLLRHTMPVVH